MLPGAGARWWTCPLRGGPVPYGERMSNAPTLAPDPAVLARRLDALRERAASAGVDAVVVTPGADLRYLTGYDAIPLERLTALVVRTGADPVMVVPALELLAAQASPVSALGMDIRTWEEGEDAQALVSALVPGARRVALDDLMWAEKVLKLRAAMPSAEQVLAGPLIAPMRMRKDSAEVAALRAAGAAIDAVHAQVPTWLRAGRTEAEVGRDIGEAIIASGHATVDFIIVGSGPNSASPHHAVSDRVIERGDAVVVDIGGTMPSGYCSDSTRMFVVGTPAPEYVERYAALQAAQQAARDAVRPGVSCEAVDAAARTVLDDAGLGELFIHRTGHGIGLQTHEEPYIIAGNELPLDPGMAFSIEPGFYAAGVHGARIEDIVVCTADGYESMNNSTRDLVLVDA